MYGVDIPNGRIPSMQEDAMLRVQSLGYTWDEESARWIDPNPKKGRDGTVIEVGTRLSPKETLGWIESKFERIESLRTVESIDSWDRILQFYTLDKELFYCFAPSCEMLSALCSLYMAKYFACHPPIGSHASDDGVTIRAQTEEERAAVMAKYMTLLDSLRR